MASINSIYRRPAEYDLQYEGYDRDLGFWLEVANRYAGNLPVGEYGCGTLRVTIPLARGGHPIIGVDLSTEMLTRAYEKLAGEDDTTKQKITLFRGDMSSFNPRRHTPFNLIIVPFTAFLHLLTAKKQSDALKNMHRQLERGGRLMVDIFNPNLGRLVQGMTPHAPVMEKQILVNGNKELLTRSLVSDYNPADQSLRWIFFVSHYDAGTGELIKSYTESATLRVIFPNEWRLLLRTAGFEIEQEWGNFDFAPFDANSPRMLFLARRG